MALVKAIKSGNWSDVTVWSTAALPGNGDTVYANAFNVTIDQHVTIGGANNVDVNAGSFIVGCRYVIKTVGSTSFTSIGASANTVGIVFIATGVGSNSGVATTVATLTNLVNAAASVTAGGFFLLTSSYDLTADIAGGAVALGTALYIGGYILASETPSVTTSVNTTITGNLYGGTSPGGIAVQNNSAGGLMTVIGNVLGGNGSGIQMNYCCRGGVSVVGSVTAGSAGMGIYALGTAGSYVSVIGNVTGGTSSGGSGIYNSGDALVTVVGNVTGGSANTAAGITSNGPGNIKITGNITGGSNTCAGIYLSSSSNTMLHITGTVSGATGQGIYSTQNGSITVVGDIYAGTNQVGINTTTVVGIVTIYGSIFDVGSWAAVVCARYKMGTKPSGNVRRVGLDGTSTYVTFYSADAGLTSAQASPSDVRLGTVYASGNLTGTMQIPAAGSVDAGVVVDASTGTAILSLGSLRKLLTSSK